MNAYSARLYVDSMAAIKNLIIEYGVDRFHSLENGTPLMRIVDKIMFQMEEAFP